MDNAAQDHAIDADIVYVRPDVGKLVLSFDMPSVELPLESHRLPVFDARRARQRPSLDVEGFTLLPHASSVVRERREEIVAENAMPRDDMAPVNDAYADELLPLLAQLSGARDVFAQYNTMQVRFSSGAPARSWMGTSAFVHLDFTAEQIESLIQQTLALTGRTVRPYSRFALMQTWRVLTPPPQDRPLTLCDGRTVTTDEMIPMEFHGPEGSRNALLRSRVCAWRPEHRWYYYPAMTPDEVLVFKGFDSSMPDAMNAMHTTFYDETIRDPVPRGSVECRFIALDD